MSPPRLAVERLPIAALFLPACFIIEVILGGPVGRYGAVSLRFILLGVSCGVLLFALLLRGRVATAHRLAILSIVGFVVLNGIWVAIIPVLAGTSLHWAVREPHAFVVLIPVVLALALLRRDELARAVPWLQRIVVVASLALALFQVGLWVLGTLLGDLNWVTPLILEAIYPGAGGYLTVGVMPDGFFRVFWISTLWCLLSFFWIPVAFPSTSIRWLLRGLLLLDLFVAYSRGIWLGLLAGLVVAYGAILTRRTFGSVLVRAAVVGTLAAGALVGIAAAAGELERGTARITSTTSSSDPSIGVRVEQARYLLQLWYEHPLVGSGYGAYVPGHLRSQEVPYSYEHMPYALLAKLGVAGALICGLFCAGWAFTAWEVRRIAPAQVASFLGGSTALLVAEMTNPLVLNFVSMSILACLLLQWASLAALADRTEPSSG